MRLPLLVPRSVLVTVVATLVATAGLLGAGAARAVADPAALVAAPTGTGTTCSAQSPCALDTAARVASSGATITLTAGDYGDQALRGPGGTAESPVVIAPAPGAAVTIGRLQAYLPYATWRGVTVTTVFYIKPSAVGTAVERVHLDGAGMFVRADGVTVRDSLLEGGHSIDGIQIGRAHGVLLERNTVRDYDQLGASGLHADCVQVFDSSDVVIRRNHLGNCYNAGIILSPGARLGLSDVTIESNFIQGCVVVTAACKGGSAIDVREPTATDVVVRNNTIVDGSTRVVPLSGLTFDRNIIGWLASCDAPVTNSIIESWNRGLCATPPVARVNGNRTGSVAFVDEQNGDLHLADPASARLTPSGGQPVAADYDGLPMPRDIAGAASGAPVPTRTSSPTIAPSSAPVPTTGVTSTPPGRVAGDTSPSTGAATPGPGAPLTADPEPEADSVARPGRVTPNDVDGLRSFQVDADDDVVTVWVERSGDRIVAHRDGVGRWVVTVPAAWVQALITGDFDLVSRTASGTTEMLSGYPALE